MNRIRFGGQNSIPFDLQGQYVNSSDKIISNVAVGKSNGYIIHFSRTFGSGLFRYTPWGFDLHHGASIYKIKIFFFGHILL